MNSLTIEIVNDLMCVIDEDGNGYDCHRLESLPEAKRQLGRWQKGYAFDYAHALRDVLAFFTDQ